MPIRPYRAAALALVSHSLLLSAAARAAAPSIEMALRLAPTQPGVKYDRPVADDVAGCRLKAIDEKGTNGWIVVDPQGQTLRRFVDSNSDNVVDRWSYFQNGIEVFRDIDSNYNRKADQHRWLNTAGRRWGVDRNEDGKIERWKTISAQEVTAELVAALAARDEGRFKRLLLSGEELKSLGLGQQRQQQVADKLTQAPAAFRKLVAGDASVSSKTKWLHFSASQPGVVPAGTDGSTKDLLVYENVVAMVDGGGKSGLVPVGTLVQAGDAWRLIEAPPSPSTADTAGDTAGFFFQVAHRSGDQNATAASGTDSSRLQELLADVEKLDRQLADAPPSERPKLHAQQADLYEQLYRHSTDDQHKTAWLKQAADNISAAVQAGNYPTGVARLDALVKKLQDADAPAALESYARYRRLLADYSQSMQAPKADYVKIQEQWLENLETFVENYPKTEDTAEAMLQLAIAHEFSGEEEKAKLWYGRVATNFSSAPQARKATGARRRLDSVGKPLALKGKSTTGGTVDLARYRGRVVVLQYWATWCEPCKADMKELAKLVATYGRRGFSVVGISVDQDAKAAADYLRSQRITWANIHEQGGMESRPANELGILTLPTMILLDQKGNVVNRNVHVAELEDELRKRLR